MGSYARARWRGLHKGVKAKNSEIVVELLAQRVDFSNATRTVRPWNDIDPHRYFSSIQGPWSTRGVSQQAIDSYRSEPTQHERVIASRPRAAEGR